MKIMKLIKRSSIILLISGLMNLPVPVKANHTMSYTPIQKDPKKYALLIGGGTTEENSFPSFYENIKLFNETIKKKGFEDENILILYHGKPNKQYPLSEGKATKETVKKALEELANKIAPKDKLVIFRSGHGYTEPFFEKYGLLNAEEAKSLREKGKELKVKGMVSVMNYPDGDYSSKAFKNALKKIKSNKIIILSQCHAGEFTNITQELDNTVVITETSEYEIGFKPELKSMWKDKGWPFVRYLCDALNQTDKDGKKLCSDKNQDGKVSISEAFEYLSENNPLVTKGMLVFLPTEHLVKEHPQIKYGKSLKKGKVFL